MNRERTTYGKLIRSYLPLDAQLKRGSPRRVEANGNIYVKINLIPTSVGMKMFLRLPITTSVPALFSGSRRIAKFRDATMKYVGLVRIYKLILTQRRAICDALDAVAYAMDNNEGPVLVHCIHGKDRTGLVIALILLACDVPERDVIRDYASSGPRLLQAKRDGTIPSNSPMFLDDSMMVTPATVMESVLAWMKEKYKPKKRRKSDVRDQSANAAAKQYLIEAGHERTLALLRTHLMVTHTSSGDQASTKDADNDGEIVAPPKPPRRGDA